MIYMVLLTLLGTSLIGIPQTEAATDLQINDEDDDAGEYGSGTFSTTGNTVAFYSNPNTGIANYRCSGFRFENIPVNHEQQIENAYLELYFADKQNINVLIYAHDADNSADFVANANIIDNTTRPKTDNYLVWAENGVGINDWENSDNFANILQEVVDRAGWEDGNAITILLIGNADQIIQGNARSYDFNSSLSAQLHIHWQPTIGDVEYPTLATPHGVVHIMQELVSHGQGADNITAKITFSSSEFWFMAEYPENDNTIENCGSNQVVCAEWFVAMPDVEDNYTFYTEWEFIHEDYHYVLGDTQTIEVRYFENLPAEHGNPGNVGVSVGGGGEALAMVAIGIALIGTSLALAKGGN